MQLTWSYLILATAAVAHACSQELPTADHVIAKMMDRDAKRQSALRGYTAVRRYTLENDRHHKRAEMLVRMKCLEDGSKQFETVSASGWGGARKFVFPRLLETEKEASLPNVRERSRIIPENYSFEMLGTDSINDRPAYVLAIAPKTKNKYLVQGRIWVDRDEYAIVRIEGKPSRSLSFWIERVTFVHNYQKSGSIWLPMSDRSVTEIRIFGTTELRIEYFDYVPNGSRLSESSELVSRSLP